MTQTLRAMRGRIEALASQTGEYQVVCAHSGQRPVPVDGAWFPDQETARAAAATAAAYRDRLRTYDPRTPVHEFEVCRRTTRKPTARSSTPRREGDA